MQKRWLAMTGVIAVVAVSGVAFALSGEWLDEVTPVTGVREVVVEDNSFASRVIEVPRETEVTWRWDGERDHNVVAESFQSPVQTDGVFAHTFETPGTYDYACTLHRGMTGRVVVAGN